MLVDEIDESNKGEEDVEEKIKYFKFYIEI